MPGAGEIEVNYVELCVSSKSIACHHDKNFACLVKSLHRGAVNKKHLVLLLIYREIDDSLSFTPYFFLWLSRTFCERTTNGLPLLKLITVSGLKFNLLLYNPPKFELQIWVAAK